VAEFLPERYLTALPEYHDDAVPVRELNTGKLARESVYFGVERFAARGEDGPLEVRVGDCVELTEEAPGEAPQAPRRGRVTAVYLDGAEGGLCLSLRPVLTEAEVASAYRLREACPWSSSSSDLWELDTEIERVPLSLVAGRLDSAAVRGRFSPEGQGAWRVELWDCGVDGSVRVRAGDCVEFAGAQGRGLPAGKYRGRIVSIAASEAAGESRLSLRELLSAEEVAVRYKPEAPAPSDRGGRFSGFWEVGATEEVIPAALILRKLTEAEAPVGTFYAEGKGAWEAAVRRGGSAGNIGNFPVAKLGVVAWADTFKTFQRREHSTALVAFTYNALPFALRRSRGWVKVLCCTPSDVNEVAAFRIVFSSLLELEQGVVVEGAPRCAGESGKIFARVGLFACLGDSPYQAKLASSLSPNGQLPCPLDFYDMASNPYSDQVSRG